jgi:hypothetical protein
LRRRRRGVRGRRADLPEEVQERAVTVDLDHDGWLFAEDEERVRHTVG